MTKHEGMTKPKCQKLSTFDIPTPFVIGYFVFRDFNKANMTKLTNMTNMNNDLRKQLGWPAAATLIAALLSASLAFALAPVEEKPSDARYASAREIGEVKAGLKALERSTEQLRTDIRELRDLVVRLVNDR